MLELLREQIRLLSRSRKGAAPSRMIRTLFATASPSLVSVRRLFRETFPLPEALEGLCSWVAADPAAPLSAQAAAAVSRTFSAAFVDALASANVELIGSINQVVLLADC